MSTFKFDETMSGWLGVGEKDCLVGRMAGEKNKTPCHFDAQIIIDDLNLFTQLGYGLARLEGTITFDPLGGTFPMEDGNFHLFSINPDKGYRQLVYTFGFTDKDGNKYFLYGEKNLQDDPGFDMVEDLTTLFTTIYAGKDRNAPRYAMGQLYFNLKDLPKFLFSMGVPHKWWEIWKWPANIKASIQFNSFAWHYVREIYLSKIDPFYETQYENLVLSGKVTRDGPEREFFLVSGKHDKGFPWGDGEEFSDVLLVIKDESSGYRKYCISDRVLKNMDLNVEQGSYSYKGPLFALPEGQNATSFKLMRNEAAPCQADFTVNLEAQPHSLTPLPFAKADNILAQIAWQTKWVLKHFLPGEYEPGIAITPYTVKVKSGALKITEGGQATEYHLVPEQTFGEAESSTFKNIRYPTLLYGYICALRPQAQVARVQIHSNVMRTARQRWAQDQVAALMGAIISRVASVEMLMEGGELKTPGKPATLFIKLDQPLLEINNDHYPTADFFRRIIQVKDPSGETCLALEEDMSLLRLEPLQAEGLHEEVKVASIRGASRSDEDKKKALDQVLEETEFFKLVSGAQQKSGTSKADFAIVIKPNFMFAYNRKDQTTYTDPDLVVHLIEKLKDQGFKNLTIVEAQSTYGEFFNNRGVLDVAKYLGYTIDGSAGYRVVDLTEDQSEEQHLGPYLGRHPVPLTWKKADFRISFAKNKTHAYAQYTLTLKNIYGALPLADKFTQYHHRRDIYFTTMEYLDKFPVDYGLIDAYWSADGPFGIFADPEPNLTQTIIGGANLVAVDWVGASKMGLDPETSPYMVLAVNAFGKPKIKLVGDASVYRPWLNVPVELRRLLPFVLDAHGHFGKSLYMVGAYMDEDYFTHKNKSEFVKLAREALHPLQTTLFLQAPGERSLSNKLLSKFLTWLGSH